LIIASNIITKEYRRSSGEDLDLVPPFGLQAKGALVRKCHIWTAADSAKTIAAPCKTVIGLTGKAYLPSWVFITKSANLRPL